MIAYLILTATLTGSAGFTIGYHVRPFTPPAPGCACRDQAETAVTDAINDHHQGTA